MARSVKHQGFGRYIVLADGAPVGQPFTGPGAKERAEEFARNPPPPKVNPVVSERAYWAQVNAVLAKPVSEEMIEHQAVFAKYHDAETVRLLMSILEPHVRAGKQARRRARRMHLLPAAA